MLYDPEKPNDYASYLNGIEPAAAESGGQFIHTMTNPRFVSHATPPPGPSEINIVEWETESGLAKFQESAGFLEHYPLLHSGTVRFELYRIQPVIK